ncbi:hypothetical protein [Pseudomonas sp. Q2-TVG4-2]|uniref:hypothetical protein n=1 Tax=Pseudomonas sp. Q2-TVG4-2 TaxID=1685699 RepID=UPI0015E716CF|nr:hypothetical protein [Pseudomonas sp. Q2-TVG4-2]
MPINDQHTSAVQSSTQIGYQLGEAERAAFAGRIESATPRVMQHHRRSVEAQLQPHASERLSLLEEQLIAQSPIERELSNLFDNRPAEANQE